MSQITHHWIISYRLETARNIAFVAFPDVEMLVIARQTGPLRTFAGEQIVADHACAELDQSDRYAGRGGRRGRFFISMFSKLRSAWASWISLWSFLAHLNDLDFYKGLDEQREISIAPWASRRDGVSAIMAGQMRRRGICEFFT